MQKQIDKILLRDNCEKQEEISYMKQFTPEQIREQKDSLAEISIQINDIENSKKEVVKEFSDSLKPLTDSKKTLLTNIKQKAEFVTENAFKFFDDINKEVGWYSGEGDLIESRPAHTDEMQLSIPLHKKTGTNN